MSDVKAVEKRKVRPGEGGYITAIEEEGQTRRDVTAVKRWKVRPGEEGYTTAIDRRKVRPGEMSQP